MMGYKDWNIVKLRKPSWWLLAAGAFLFFNAKMPEAEGLLPVVNSEQYAIEGIEMESVVVQIAEKITAERIMYNSRPLSDCSGIFHQFMKEFHQYFPNVDIPGKQIRSTREIGKWYDKSGQLEVISNPLKQGKQIKVGTIMFYGKRPKGGRKHYKQNLFQSGIQHIGIVVKVHENPRGEIDSYRLFHGRSSGKPAGITNYHKREYANTKKYPPYGNGRQDWLAMVQLDV